MKNQLVLVCEYAPTHPLLQPHFLFHKKSWGTFPVSLPGGHMSHSSFSFPLIWKCSLHAAEFMCFSVMFCGILVPWWGIKPMPPALEVPLQGSLILTDYWASLVAQMVESACTAGDPDSVPGSGRSPREGNGNPRQYSMDGGAWWATVQGVAKSRTQLSD